MSFDRLIFSWRNTNLGTLSQKAQGTKTGKPHKTGIIAKIAIPGLVLRGTTVLILLASTSPL